MTTRHMYFINPDRLSDAKEYKAVFDFALDQARTYGCDLTLVINNKSNHMCFLEYFLDDSKRRLLEEGKVIKFGSTKVKLESRYTLKDYRSYGVLCAFHAGPETISKMENSSDPISIIVLGEKTEQHLIDWTNSYSPQYLSRMEA